MVSFVLWDNFARGGPNQKAPPHKTEGATGVRRRLRRGSGKNRNLGTKFERGKHPNQANGIEGVDTDPPPPHPSDLGGHPPPSPNLNLSMISGRYFCQPLRDMFGSLWWGKGFKLAPIELKDGMGWANSLSENCNCASGTSTRVWNGYMRWNLRVWGVAFRIRQRMQPASLMKSKQYLMAGLLHACSKKGFAE